MMNLVSKFEVKELPGDRCKMTYLGTSRIFTFQQVKEYLDNLPPKLKEQLDQKIEEYQNQTSNIYIVYCKGFFKIGYANNVHSRIKDMQVGNPFPIELIASFKVRDYKMKESMIHKALDHKKILGEWFELDGSDSKIIKDILLERE